MKAEADILVEVGGDVSPLARALRAGGRDLDTFATKSARIGRRMAKIGSAMAAALTIGATATTGLARRAAEAAVEIENLSRVAGTTPTEFQKWAIAARTVGIEHDKLSDILKDVQDRVGDFIATGGGPMADFFEKIAPQVGVTAEQFARLSGPDALQLYVSSLEKANVTQAEFTFYMEAMASDATALLPLLRDGGRVMNELGDEAERSGRILSGETLRGAERLRNKLDELEGEIRTELTTALIGLEDEIVLLAQFVKDYGIPALEGLIRFGAGVAKAFDSAAVAMKALRDPAAAAAEGAARSIGGDLGVDPEGGVTRDPVLGGGQGTGDAATDKALRDLYGLDGEGDSPGIKPGNHLVPEVEIPTAPIGLNNRDPATLGFDDIGGGGGRSGPTEEDLRALEESLASERELIELDYQEKLEALNKFREEKVGKEEEWNALEERIQKEHNEKIAELEAAKRQARMQALAGMFGDLSSLMQSENKKLFEIGKAAAIAEATVNGYEAAVAAWEKGMKIGGPPMAAAFTAASLAKTGALISSIASTSASGSGGGGGGGGATAAPAAAEAAPAPQQVNLNIGEAEWLPRSAVISLAEKLQELSREGAIVTVN
ncbi:hypothetical protein [Rhodovulum marinum]|uniref:Tail length tape measure protein n=1 Tax=Rhodovulum marinum TaxID=320662 RepID=A0A4R2QAL4_9RHOB|nr:hypothetical protein [Rhodovulum marinum]TCP43931.1 hypothetical protein EV662_10114 [Rhodovulum marinum]